MNRPSENEINTIDNFSFEEKITALYLYLYEAKDQIFKRIDKAFYQKKISAASRTSWKRIFENEFSSCTQIRLNTIRDCAYLEFKARHLMNAVENLDFNRKEPWQGFSIPLENAFFKVFKRQ